MLHWLLIWLAVVTPGEGLGPGVMSRLKEKYRVKFEECVDNFSMDPDSKATAAFLLDLDPKRREFAACVSLETCVIYLLPTANSAYFGNKAETMQREEARGYFLNRHRVTPSTKFMKVHMDLLKDGELADTEEEFLGFFVVIGAKIQGNRYLRKVSSGDDPVTARQGHEKYVYINTKSTYMNSMKVTDYDDTLPDRVAEVLGDCVFRELEGVLMSGMAKVPRSLLENEDVDASESEEPPRGYRRLQGGVKSRAARRLVF